MTQSFRAPRHLALAVALALAGPALAAKPAAKPAAEAKAGAFVTVNGTPVSKNLADAFIAEQTAQGAPDSPELRDAVREELVRREIMAQEARKRGLDKQPKIIAQGEMARQAVLIRAFIEDHLKNNPVTDADLRAEYDRIKTQQGSEEYKSRHVLVDKEDEAKAIIDKLAKGAKIEDLAKDSKDPGSKNTGGDLGWSPAAAYVKPFADALAKLEKGKYTTTPVKTDFGYHVILLEDKRAVQPPAFEQVKPQIQQRVQEMRVQKLIAELRTKAKVE